MLCKLCGLDKELNSSNFQQGTNKRNGINHHYWYRTCRACNRDKIRDKNKRFKEKNRKKLADKQKLYRASRQEHYSQIAKIWYQKNKEDVKIRIKNNLKLRRQTDPLFRLKFNISANIRACIKKNYQPVKNFLPYSIAELKKHLEQQFEPWMNWNNYGTYSTSWNDQDPQTWTWQIDHIIPQSSFYFTSMADPQFLACWGLNNLRPYSSKMNLLDSNKRV